jgi:hypothetical protein
MSEISHQSTKGVNPHIYIDALFIVRILLVESVMLYCLGLIMQSVGRELFLGKDLSSPSVAIPTLI